MSPAMIVGGIMSGTSADGIDVALVRIRGTGWKTRLELLSHQHKAYPSAVRKEILELMNAGEASVAELSRLNFLLGELYVQAVLKTLRAAGLKAQLIGCHGQTLYHQGEALSFLGHKVRATWQTGEAAVIAARIGVPVVSDFRPADLAAGGKGAPLVPLLDYLYFHHPRRGRILQNLGGIGNLTAIPAGARSQDVIAFDTGPGNMVIDAVTEKLFGQPYDRNGTIAARGKVIAGVVDRILQQPFFRQAPPRTAGREQFGREFSRDFIHQCRTSAEAPVRKEDIVATATTLTAESVSQSIQKFVLRSEKFQELIASGGGTRNRSLMKMLAERVLPLGLSLHHSDDFGLPSEAKEAVAFALLAYQTWRRQPGNIPSATGARRSAILGKISLP